MFLPARFQLLEHIEDPNLLQAIRDENLSKQTEICNDQKASTASVMNHMDLIGCMILILIGGIGCGFVAMRFKHELDTAQEPTVGDHSTSLKFDNSDDGLKLVNSFD